MRKDNTQSLSSKRDLRQDTKKINSQSKKAFDAFHEQPKTMLMVSVETGIRRANLCRSVAKWRKRGCVEVVKKGICKISNYPANYLSTNQDLFSGINQLQKV